MIELHDAEILDLAVTTLHRAIRRAAAEVLTSPGPLETSQFRHVERLMRLAVALAGQGSCEPFVEMHGIPPGSDESVLPGLLSVSLTDMLAARASDHLPGALQGDPEALRALEREAEQMLGSEDIQLG